MIKEYRPEPKSAIIKSRTELKSRTNFQNVISSVVGIAGVTVIAMLLTRSGTLSDVAENFQEHTIHVQRGGRSFDVAVSDKPDAILLQNEKWNEQLLRFERDIKDNVHTGFALAHRLDAASFVYRNQPPSLLRFLNRLLENEDVSRHKKIRAARWRLLFQDDDNSNWIVSELENPACQDSLLLLWAVGESVDTKEKLHLDSNPLKLTTTPVTRTALTESFQHFSRKSSSITIDEFEVCFTTVANALKVLPNKDVRQILQSLLPASQDEVLEEHAAVSDWVMAEYGRRFCDRHLLDRCIELATNVSDNRKPIPHSVQRCFERLCVSLEPELSEDATQAYAQIIKRAPRKFLLATSAIQQGVAFDDNFMDWLRTKLRGSAGHRAAGTLSMGRSGNPDSNQFNQCDTSVVATIFAGTNDREVIDALHQIMAVPKDFRRSHMSKASLYECALAIEAVSGQPMDTATQRRMAMIKTPIVQCESKTRANRKTRQDIAKLFHKHRLASDLYDENSANSGHVFCSYDLICDAFSSADRAITVDAEHKFQSSFWALSDMTDGKFRPAKVHFETDKQTGGAICTFLWKGKRFSFQTPAVTSNLIPPLNAILQSEGIGENFVVAKGHQSIQFFERSPEKVLLAPTKLLEELETVYGLYISVR